MIYFAYQDPCRSSEPGWPLRNLLCLLFYHATDFAFSKTMKFLSIRGTDLERAIVFTVRAKDCQDREAARQAIFTGAFVGWEVNANGKMGPNIADLSDSMDPIKSVPRNNVNF